MSGKNEKGGVRTFNLFNITVTGPGQDAVLAEQTARTLLEPLPLVNLNSGIINKQKVFGKVHPPGALQLEVSPDGTAQLCTSANGRVVVLSCRVSESFGDRAELLGRVKFTGSSEQYPEIEFVCEPEGTLESDRRTPALRTPVHTPSVVLRGGVPPPPPPPPPRPHPEVSDERVSGLKDSVPPPPPVQQRIAKVPRPIVTTPAPAVPRPRPDYIALAAPPPPKIGGSTRGLLGRASRAAERGQDSLRELEPLLEDLKNLDPTECKSAIQLGAIVRTAREVARVWTALADKLEGK